MTVTQITDQVLFGSTADTKPTAGIAANTLYFEIDSGRVYKFTGGVWSLFSGDNKPETLTNKTLTTPIISSIKNGSSSATISIPTITDTLVGRNTTDTLANKTLLAPTITTINNGGVITLPSGTRTLVARDTADTLLNKTINVNSNSLIATSQIAGDILVNNGTQFLRLAKGTNGQFLQSTASTLQWADVISSGGAFEYVIDYISTRTAGTQYRAVNKRTGAIVAQGATLDPVLTSVFSTIAALTYFGSGDSPRGGTVYIGSGWHLLSGSFAGWDIPEMTRVVMSPNTFINVVQGYTGYVFSFKGYTSGQSSPYWGSHVSGGYIREAGTPSRLWDAFLFLCVNPDSSGAVYGCSIRDTQVQNANRAIHLKTTDSTGLSYVNGITVFNLVTADCVTAIDFNQNGMALYTGGTGAFNHNEFYSIVGQSGAHSVTGVKNITGIGNMFIGVKIWDVSLGGGSGVTSNILSSAKNTIIHGGIMTSQNFTDNGINTIYSDDVKGFNVKVSSSSAPRATIGVSRFSEIGLETNIISPLVDGSSTGLTFNQYNNTSYNVAFVPFSDSTTLTNSYQNKTGSERFYIQKNSTQYLFDFVKQTSGGSLRPALFRMFDVPASSAVEAFRIETDATVRFQNGKFILRNPANTFNAIVNAPAIVADTTYSLPMPAAGTTTDTIMTASQTYGPVKGKKYGRFEGTSTGSGDGVFAGGFTTIGTANGFQADSTNGGSSQFTSGASAGANAGHSYLNTYTTRAWNPYLGIRFKLGTATNNRVYAGFISTSTAPAAGSEDPLANISGVLLVQRSTDTTFQICVNNGAASSTFTNTGVTVDNTTVFTIEIRGDASNNKFAWSLNGSTYADLTTNIPAATTLLTYTAHIQTAEAVAHTIRIYATETRSDK